MTLYKTIALVTFILISTLSCSKADVAPSYADKLIGYYSGDIDQFDTLAVNGNSTPVKYDSWLGFFIQKSKNAPFAIKYATNTNYIVNGYIHTGSTESEGLIENISLSKENSFLINETAITLWGKPVLLTGSGRFEETSNSLILDLTVNDSGQFRKLSLKLARQKVRN